MMRAVASEAESGERCSSTAAMRHHAPPQLPAATSPDLHHLLPSRLQRAQRPRLSARRRLALCPWFGQRTCQRVRACSSALLAGRQTDWLASPATRITHAVPATRKI
jgi:hypothetical protein